jgi:hypothetical protein
MLCQVFNIINGEWLGMQLWKNVYPSDKENKNLVLYYITKIITNSSEANRTSTTEFVFRNIDEGFEITSLKSSFHVLILKKNMCHAITPTNLII